MSLLLLFNPATTGGITDAYVEPVNTYGFTQAKEVVVRLQGLDGSWEVCGADTARGITPEKVQLTSDQWGSKTASFDLRRDPRAVWPDITAFTPVEIEVGGRLVWSGRVNETPITDSVDSVISVQCEGWQAHLDDDLYERVYVHTDLTEWRDMRSFPNAKLGAGELASAGVVTQDGSITLSWPRGAIIATASDKVAVQLDLGPNSAGKRIVMNYQTSNNDGNAYLLAVASTDEYLSNFQSSSPLSLNVASSTLAFTFTDARRYIAILLQRGTSSGYTVPNDLWVRITSIQVFSDTAYESGNASILKADQVIKDSVNRATLLLSSDQSQVAAGTFNIPELAPNEPKTPREMWNAVNAFEDYQTQVDVLKRPVFKAKPSTPDVEVGAWSGLEFEDSSANSGDDIYNRVIVTGTKGDNTLLRAVRTQADQPSLLLGVPSSPVPDNASFDVNTTGWTTVGSTITRDTGASDTSPAAGRWDNTGASDALSFGDRLVGAFTGTFVAGRTYVVSFRMKASAAGWTYAYFGVGPAVGVDWPDGITDFAMNPYVIPSTSGYTTFSLTWTPKATVTSGVKLTLSDRSAYFGQAAYFWMDSVTLYTSRTTLVDRREFLRSKAITSSFTLTEGAAQQIADKWLLGHKTSPFKGRAKLVGNNGARVITSGRAVPAEELLLRTGELIRFNDRIDPDTGAVGRDGRLVEAQYDADTDSVNLTIDSSRAGFEALLERLGVVLGQNRFS